MNLKINIPEKKRSNPGLTIETEFLYKILPDLPHPPEELLQQNLATDKPNHIPQIPHFEGFKRDDGQTVSPEIKAWLCPDNLDKWVQENIGPTNRGLMYRKVMIEDDKKFYPPHIDVNRKFVMLYNLVDSGGEFCFWQEKGQPVTRSMLSRAMCFDYSQMDLLVKFKPPVRTWYITNVQVLHSVENLTAIRENIQFNCEPTDPLVMDHLKPIKPNA
jgi:hypothetical protein